MMQPCRHGETSGGNDRRGLRRRGALAIGLVLFLIGACASTGESGTAPRGVLDPSGALFAGAYRQIRDYYLDPISVETLAVASVGALDPDHLGMAVDERDHVVRLASQGQNVAMLGEPDANDAEGWAMITSTALATARRVDPALAAATDEELYQRAFDGITGKLDRFTRYAGADAARDQKAARDGFGGVGLTLDFSEPEPRVTTVLANGPSAKLGVIKLDDRLLSIDGVPTPGLDQSHIIAKLRGRPDSRVALTLRHSQHDNTYAVTVQRALIVPPSVTAETEDGIGILHVSGFNADTAKSLGQQIARLRSETGKHLTGFVLDLRGNPGGLLDQAVDVAALFLNRGQVVATKGRHPTSMQDFEASGNDQTHGLPLVVLVNGGSASSAEIVAAALQDHGRAIVVGSSSYGKGTVQMVWPLENTGELTLTWARLVTPSGTILHNHGVVPAFCTSGQMQGEAGDAQARLAQIIERGLHPAPGIESRPRASLTDAAWEELRNECPADLRESDLDLKIAKHVLRDPALYAEALTLPGIAVARAPDGHAVRSALQ